MLRSLLVPLDGTRFSEYALPLAEGVARATGAALHLAHVHVPHPPVALLSNTQFHFEGLDLDDYETQDRRLERHYLAAMAERVGREADAPVDTALLEGEVPATLNRYCQEVGADAVVLATHSRTGARRAWMGSVAEALIRAGNVPVLTVHAEETGDVGPPLQISNILVPLDGSDLAEGVLPAVTELAMCCDARITLLHILTHRHPAPGGMVPALPEQWSKALDRGEEYMDGVAGRVRGRGLRADTVVLAHPNPAEAIREVAEESRADLVAMATHGYTGLRRVLFGSVAEVVLRHGTIPMLIVRPG